jgi:hypothetical protein
VKKVWQNIAEITLKQNYENFGHLEPNGDKLDERYCKYMRCNNLIIGMAAAFDWGVRQPHIPKNIRTCSNLRLYELQN